MQDLYIRKSYRRLLEAFKVSLSDEFDNKILIRLLVFILFLLEVLVIYIFIWIPLVSRLNTKVNSIYYSFQLIYLVVENKVNVKDDTYKCIG